MLKEFRGDQRYRVSGTEDVLTPALILYPDFIAANIQCTLNLLNGDANRWRAHIKTAKLGLTLQMLVSRGIHNFKCATTLELLVACQNGATDVLLAYPVMGANARRAQEIAQQFPGVRISVLAEDEDQVRQWHASRVGIFLDINPGMNRTGIDQNHTDRVVHLARAIVETGIEFRGLHYYDGQFGSLPEDEGTSERTHAAHRGYDRLLEIVNTLDRSGIPVSEVITSGTPTFPSSLTYDGFRRGNFLHRASPGTVVYCDASSLEQLPSKYGYQPAALVLTRVVSHPHPGIVTCDAGHKTVSADAGVPTCVIIGHPQLTPLSPSEEHLPIAVKPGATAPQVGEVLYVLPRHICPTVNNFDCALLVRNGSIESMEAVSARGREAPILQSSERPLTLRG
jgi:D-serine deaminase-like pyridoxal phosphate-dependent protein